MSVIWKFPLKFALNKAQTIKVPQFSYPVAFAVQGGVPTIWFKVPGEPPHTTESDSSFMIVGTGHEFAEGVSSIKLPNGAQEWMHAYTAFDGAFVWHLLEKLPNAFSQED